MIGRIGCHIFRIGFGGSILISKKSIKTIRMVSNCVFCKIIDGSEKAEIYYQDDQAIIFKDIKPAASHHFLVVPKEHIKNAKVLTPDQKGVVENLYDLGKNRLNELGIDHSDALFGFHWPPFNTINHLHLHVIAMRSEMGFIASAMFKPNSWWFVTPEYVIDRLTKEAASASSNL